jgi:sensor domain CHASE-containing protein
VAFLVSFTLAIGIGVFINRMAVDAKRISAEMMAQGYAQKIQEKIQTAMLSTYVLGALVKQSNGRLGDFESTAAEIIMLFPTVSALQLAPDGVIQDIYPLAGNEGAIGHNLLSDRQRNREAVEAITRRQVTLAGPFKLIQGGVGAVGRHPIFLTNERNENHFWGFANALIRIPALVESAGLRELERSGYRYELWRTHPETEKRDVFAASIGDAPLESPTEYVITVYGGRWILSVAPEQGWTPALVYMGILGASLLFALAVTLLLFWGLNFLPRRLPSQQ